MLRRGPFLLCLLLLAACQRTASLCASPAPQVATGGAAQAGSPPATSPAAAVAVLAPVAEPLAPCQAHGAPPLEAAGLYLEAGQLREALSCAAQACALEPERVEAHATRGSALAALGRMEEAQLALARALALEPGHAEALLAAAHLYAVQLPSSRDRDELGALYAERGLTQYAQDKELLSRFAHVAAVAFNDLGQSSEALARATLALAHEPDSREAAYERALALFELCRFAEARQAFGELVGSPEHAAHAHHHLGLLLERQALWEQAQHHFNRAQALEPEHFPVPPVPTQEEFREEVARAVQGLPEDMRKDLAGVPVSAEDLPVEEDLISSEPPLSPAILGLFRGPPLSEPCEGLEVPCRSVVLYRLNLARAVRSREELREQIRVTLLHEVGHLRGEDDDELAARGLE
jgi:tetratricopeptide (TPR) repeat protein